MQMPSKGCSNKIKLKLKYYFSHRFNNTPPQITAFSVYSVFDLSVRFNPLTRNSIMKEKRKYKAAS